jgi:hypothetical protein
MSTLSGYTVDVIPNFERYVVRALMLLWLWPYSLANWLTETKFDTPFST